MDSTRRAPDAERRAGLWSTVTAAVQGGWGQTVRLILILVVLGGGFAVPAAAGGGGLMSVLRMALTGGH